MRSDDPINVIVWSLESVVPISPFKGPEAAEYVSINVTESVNFFDEDPPPEALGLDDDITFTLLIWAPRLAR